MGAGKLKMWNTERGYGFIADDAGGPDLFLHVSALESAGIDPLNIRKGDRLTLDLVEYEGPQLLLLSTNRKRYMFAMAVARADMQEPFFGCEVVDKVYEQYFQEKADLHFVFNRALGKAFYLFDLADATNDVVSLKKATADEAQNPDYWPQIGFFARSHTTEFNRPAAGSSTRKFKIDGKWGSTDFSQFHNKMADLYALFGVVNRLDGNQSQVELGWVRQTIRDRFWQGGGSYGSFYDSLIERNKKVNVAPLEIDKIQYASPGEITLRGNQKALTDVSDVLDVFEENWEQLAGAYRNIYGALKKEKLLSARPSSKFSSPAVRKVVQDATMKLAAGMQVELVDEIYEACERNTLVFAKVILSIYRRANELFKFHAEGRVQRG
jgi:cold shock CspA family protein